MSTARSTFHHIATLIRSGLEESTPPGRRAATAATFEQVAEIAGDLPLSRADARAGFDRLSIRPVDRTDEPANVTARRKTCGEIAALITADSLAYEDAGDLGGAEPERLAAVMDAIASLYVEATDRRQAAMRDTAVREAQELRS